MSWQAGLPGKKWTKWSCSCQVASVLLPSCILCLAGTNIKQDETSRLLPLARLCYLCISAEQTSSSFADVRVAGNSSCVQAIPATLQSNSSASANSCQLGLPWKDTDLQLPSRICSLAKQRFLPCWHHPYRWGDSTIIILAKPWHPCTSARPL